MRIRIRRLELFDSLWKGKKRSQSHARPARPTLINVQTTGRYMLMAKEMCGPHGNMQLRLQHEQFCTCDRMCQITANAAA